ncbi:hypothetical protein H072_9484 [Dactylellina haptotyla CBS 200.50]|uniref:Uncharacterized protein n=1 Tax=Dactylellina haptotyla (strain CBS 200.50) TaxID=1284197 RepID=S8A2E4_DACHA|nr:hypothetical protein H072_9484 [Dactylellina haptotyla CBS 200.50]
MASYSPSSNATLYSTSHAPHPYDNVAPSMNEGYPPYEVPYHSDTAAIGANFGNLSIQSSGMEEPPLAFRHANVFGDRTGPHRNPNSQPYNQPGPQGRTADPTSRHEPSNHQIHPMRNHGDPQRRPPPAEWHGRSGPPNPQRRPPPSGPPNSNGPSYPGSSGRAPAGRGHFPPPHSQGHMQFHRPRPPPPPPPSQGPNSYNQGQVWPERQHDSRGYGRGANLPRDLGRSQTMPMNPRQERIEFPQDSRGQAFHDGHNIQNPYNGPDYSQYESYNGNVEHGNPQSRGFDSMRGSVGDVLDLYTYDDSYSTRPSYDARSNSMRNDPYYSSNHNQPHHLDQSNPYDQHQQYHNNIVPQAHRSKSQPNLRGDGYTPAGFSEPVPPLPQNNQQPQFSGAWSSQMNGSFDAAPSQTNPNPRPIGGNQMTSTLDDINMSHSLSTSRPPPQRTYPNQPPTDYSKMPQQTQPNLSSVSMVTSDDPDALPEHPAPIRPGLASDNASVRSGISQHTPNAVPVNPLVAQGRMSPHDVGPVTFDMLNLMRNEIAGKPANQPANPSIQLRFAKRLVEASFVLVNDSDSKAARRSRENFTLEAHKIVKKISSGTHPYPEAMFYLANCYGDGALGLEVDHDRAFTLYQSAAKLNHPLSAYRTAVCCEIGAGTKKEPQKAFQWYRKAATLGDTAAMYKVGMIQHKGHLGQPRNDREAIVWLKRAAEQADEENPHALHQLGLLYESADGNGSIVRDVAYAKELFTKAAELGYPPSQYRLGTAYAYGLIGCPVDAKLSITWYSRAAASGDAESELALAGWYLTGAEGILEQNDTEAYLWSRKAAEQGLAKAEFAVGHLTELGIGLDGVPKCLVTQYAGDMLTFSAGQGHQKAKERLEEMRRGAPKKQARERLSRHNKAKDDADCIVM